MLVVPLGSTLVRAIVLATMVGFASRSHAALDVSGGWDVETSLSPATTRRMMVEQNGNALEVRLEGVFGSDKATGTIDPETRVFHVGNPAVTGTGSLGFDCGAFRVDA